MGIGKEYLERLSIYDLRQLGRDSGVKAPTKLRKQELIVEIINVQNGKSLPHFSNKGRPIKSKKVLGEKAGVGVAKLLEIESILDECKNKIIEILSSK